MRRDLAVLQGSAMKKAAKYLGLGALILVGLFLFVANFSASESRLGCSGEMSKGGSTEPATVFIRLAEYRWWAGLWSDSDGSMNLEIPNVWLEYYPHIEELGDQRAIYEGYYPQPKLKGNYSTLSRRLAIDTGFGFFDGTCSELD